MRIILEVVSGPKVGTRVELAPGQTLEVGRALESATTFGVDPYMSGRHFAVMRESDGFRVRDLGSRNGTFVNREPVHEMLLRDGDEIAAGHTTFRVRVLEVPAAPASRLAPPASESANASREDLSRPWRATDGTPASQAYQSNPLLVPQPGAVAIDQALQRPSTPRATGVRPMAKSPIQEPGRARSAASELPIPAIVRRSPVRDAANLPVMSRVLEEHFSELDFLWQQRERNIFAPDWTIRHLAAHEKRADAHLDGLRIGGEHSAAVARPFLAGKMVGAATAAGFVFLAAQSPTLAAELMDTLAVANDGVRTGIRIALRHGDVRPITDKLYALGCVQDAKLRAIAADVLSFHQLRPPPDMDLLLEDDDLEVRRLAYAAAGRVAKVITIRHVEKALLSEDPKLRRIALEAAARAGVSEVVAIARKNAQGATAIPEAVAFLGIVGTPKDLAIIRQAMREPTLAAAAIDALGALGSPTGVPLIIDAMGDAQIAERAADAFTRITGVANLRSTGKAVLSGGDRENDRPSVDPIRAASVWQGLQQRFDPDARWQRGENTSAMTLEASMRVLPLRIRHDVYLSARVARGTAVPYVELEARADVSRAMMTRPRE